MSRPAAQSSPPEPKARTRAFGRDRRGGVAIEFAAVAIPFFMLVFGTAGIGLYFLTSFMIERGVDRTARTIRTCAHEAANNGAGMTTLQLKEAFCANVPGFVDCSDKLRVQLVTVGQFSAIGTKAMTAAACIAESGGLVAETANSTDKVTIAANAIALLTACYRYDLGSALPFLDLGRVPGSDQTFIQAATAFKVEPCE
ncbi:MAG: TadE/TadG family type IV pilus assembly protein [Hyphomicrobiaceae bacterium]